jgi:hypothetical protein
LATSRFPHSISVLALVAGMTAIPVRASAQAATASVRGTVVDPHRRAVPNATVSITNEGTSQRRGAAVDSSGSFSFPQLPPASYIIEASADGFTPSGRSLLTLNVGDERVVTLELRLAGVEASVDVRAEGSRIQESPATGTVIGRDFIENMPLSGRTFQSLFDLTPGVLRSGTGNGQFVVNGQRGDANYFLVDGVSANTAVPALATVSGAAGTLPSLSVLGTTNTLASVDALQEFKILTSSFAPEFGRTPGGQVSFVTRSGSNTFTGSAFEYFRHERMEANDWFARRDGLAKPPTRQHDFGGVLGGPLVLPGYDGHDRTFFFASYEGLRLNQPQVATTTVPSLATREAAVPAMHMILDAYPLPTGGPLVDASGQPTGAARYSASYADPSELDTFSLRIDHVMGAAGHLFGRFSNSPSRQTTRPTGISYDLFTERNTRSVTLGHTWAPRTRFSHDVRVNLSRSSGRAASRLIGVDGAVPTPDSALFPSFADSNTASLTFQINFGAEIPSLAVGRSANNRATQFNIVDNLLVNMGAHALKFGIDYRRLDTRLGINTSISPNFPTIDALVRGVVPTLSVTARQRGLNPVVQNLSVYAQDTWRAHERLTATYGVRWELNPAPGAPDGFGLMALTGTDSPATIDIAPPDTPFFPTRYDNIAPRGGLAFQLGRRPRWETVLRGGAGLYFDLGTAIALLGYEGYPYRITVDYPNVTFPPATAAHVVAPTFTTSPPYTTTFGYAPDFVSPRTTQWNLTVEQALGARQSLTLSYVGAAGRKLTRTDGYTRPNSRFSTSVGVTRNSASSDYESFQVQYTQRLHRGLQAIAAYTWSHSTDTASNAATTTNVAVSFADIEESRADSDFDVRHSFAAAVSYDIPGPRGPGALRAILGGFSTDVLIKARSAPPVTVTGRSMTAPYNGALRPDVVPGVPFYIEDSSLPGGRRINPAAFTLAPVGIQGTLPRNALRGFPARQVDLAVRREFPLVRRVRLQFRGEVFNVFNIANFAHSSQSQSLTSGTFGLATRMLNRSLAGVNALYEMGGPRSGQLAVKVLF